MMKVTDEPGLSPNNSLEIVLLSDQSMASKMSTLRQLVLTKIPDKPNLCETPAKMTKRSVHDIKDPPQEGYSRNDVS